MIYVVMSSSSGAVEISLGKGMEGEGGRRDQNCGEQAFCKDGSKGRRLRRS